MELGSRRPEVGNRLWRVSRRAAAALPGAATLVAEDLVALSVLPEELAADARDFASLDDVCPSAEEASAATEDYPVEERPSPL